MAITRHTYPDGTVSSIQPHDGQVWVWYDNNLNPISFWRRYGDNWTRIQKEKVKLKDWKWELEKEIVCECGKEKHGFASHSRWCKKFA